MVCFFKSADKFKSRYATFGFEEAARIDDGTMWPTSFGITKLSKADEQLIAELVRRARELRLVEAAPCTAVQSWDGPCNVVVGWSAWSSRSAFGNARRRRRVPP